MNNRSFYKGVPTPIQHKHVLISQGASTHPSFTTSNTIASSKTSIINKLPETGYYSFDKKSCSKLKTKNINSLAHV